MVQKQPKVEQNITQESISIAQQSTKVAPVHIAKWPGSCTPRWSELLMTFPDTGTLVESLISGWTQSASQFWADPLSATECAAIAVVVGDSECVAVALQTAFWIAIEMVTVLSSCSMAGATWSCCCLSASSVHTIQSCTSLQLCFSKPNT